MPARGAARRSASFVGGVEEALVVAVAVLIDGADRGAGEDVVELVEQHDLPQVPEFGGGVGDAGVGGEDGQGFEFAQGGFGEAVGALVLGDRGQRAAVIFEIELAHPGGEALGLLEEALAQAGEERAHLVVDDFGAAGDAALHAADIFQHAAGRATAAIAVAVNEEQLIERALLAEALVGAEHVAGDQVGAVGGVDAVVFVFLGGEEVGGHLGAIDALPVEHFVGHAVGVVPAELVGDEHVEPGERHQLRQGGGIAEGIGQPDDARRDAELLLVVAHAVKDMADEGLAARDVDVGLEPERALDLELAGSLAGLDALEQLGIVMLRDNRAAGPDYT